jgi:hypothetical protein
MMQQEFGLTGPAATKLSLACVSHMQQEEAMLAETLDSLRQIRSALRDGGLDSLKAALDRQARIAHASAELRDRRADLRRAMSAALGVSPREVTLMNLAARLPRDIAAHLTGCRDRLNDMAAEIDRLNRANAALVGQSLEFLERFLTEITDGDPGGAGYSSSGATREPVLGSLIEARG